MIPATQEVWERVRNDHKLVEMCERIKQGDKELKHRLPVWTPCCAEFKDNHRAIADALKPLHRLMMDFDEKGHTDEIVAKLLKNSPLKVLLIEESAGGGTHVLVELAEGMSPEQAQDLMALATGFEPDRSVKDVARCIYMVPADHTRYVNPEMFEVGDAEQQPQSVSNECKSAWVGTEHKIATSDNESKSGLVDNEGKISLVNNERKIAPVEQDEASQGSGSCIENSIGQLRERKIAPSYNGQPSTVNDQREGKISLSFKGLPYDSIIAEWWLRNGGKPAEGERNVKLHSLAVNLRAICDNKKEVLVQVMPRCGLSEAEFLKIIDSACKETPKAISTKMQAIVNDLLKEQNGEEVAHAEKAKFPSMSLKKMPVGIRESLIGVPPAMQMPVLCSIMPIAAAYADQVEVEYCDGNRHRLALMSIIHGEQASGKSVCTNVVNVWKRPLEEEDALARQREDAWKERKKLRKANEKVPEDPKVKIRVLPVTVSCSTLLKRLKNSQGHTLYSFCEELDTLTKTNGAGSWSQKYDVYRLSFDHGEWGQDYNSDQAESGTATVAYNWTMLGTDGALRKCFRSNNIENGLSSRILMAEMPDTSFAKMPKYGKRSDADEAQILEATKILRSCSGFIDTPRLRRRMENFAERKRVEAAKDIDRVKDVYRKRATVIGFRCGVIFHLLTGQQRESDACLNFAEMMAEYCLQQQIKSFGELFLNQYVEAKGECTRYGCNHSVFDQLAMVFTMEDLKALKRSDITDSALRKTTSRWTQDNWIEKIDSKHWRKLKAAVG